jgi:hypothetical protein
MRLLTTVGIILMSFLPSIPARAETGSTPSLISNSPFLPPGFQPPGTPGKPVAPPATSNQYEFRGVYQLGGTYYYNLYDVRERKASWLTKNEAAEMNLSILSFDQDTNELALDVDGETVSLSLVETSDRTLPVQTAPAVPTTLPATPTTQPATPEPTRRRVIRPTTRTGTTNSAQPVRRRVIRPSR